MVALPTARANLYPYGQTGWLSPFRFRDLGGESSNLLEWWLDRHASSRLGVAWAGFHIAPAKCSDKNTPPSLSKWALMTYSKATKSRGTPRLVRLRLLSAWIVEMPCGFSSGANNSSRLGLSSGAVDSNHCGKYRCGDFGLVGFFRTRRHHQPDYYWNQSHRDHRHI
jgi:hypothetical protein